MTDTPTSVAETLDVPNTPITTGEPLTFEAAVARKAELFSKPGWADRWRNGDVSARREFSELTAALNKGPADPGRTAREIEVSASIMSAVQRNEYVNQDPISKDIRDQALAMRDGLIRDPEFFARWQRGDFDARKKLSLVSQILSLPVKD
jgi:hypothetical protein